MSRFFFTTAILTIFAQGKVTEELKINTPIENDKNQ